MKNPSTQWLPTQSILQNLKIDDPLQELDSVIDFRIFNGVRNYRTKWVRGGGKDVLKWMPLSQMRPYLQQVVNFQEKNRKYILEAQYEWNKLFNKGDVIQKLQALNIDRLKRIMKTQDDDVIQSSDSQFKWKQRKRHKRQKKLTPIPTKRKRLPIKKKQPIKKATLKMALNSYEIPQKKQKFQRKRIRSSKPQIYKTTEEKIGTFFKKLRSPNTSTPDNFVPFLFSEHIKQPEAPIKPPMISLAQYINQPTMPATVETQQGELEHGGQIIQTLPDANDANGDEMSEPPSSPRIAEHRAILTDQSENDSEDDQDEFSYESEPVSEIVHHNQIRQFIEEQLKRIQEKQNLSGSVQQKGQVKLEAQEDFVWETPQRKSFPDEENRNYLNLRQHSIGLLDVISDDFQRKIEQLRNVRNCRVPEVFQNFISWKVLGESELRMGRVRINNIISLYNFREFCYFSVNIGNNYYEEQRFIEYRLLKNKFMPVLVKWLHPGRR